MLGVHRTTLENWRKQGCPGLPPGRVSIPAVRRWADRNGKRAEQIYPERAKMRRMIGEEIFRKLKMANDETEAGLISRTWLAERMARATKSAKKHRQKSEAEHPLLFAAAGSDVAKCREVVSKIWDEIMAAMHSLGADFDEGTAKKGTNE